MGRKLKLTPQVLARIVHAVEIGAPFKYAAQYGGVSYSTFAEWMRLGEAGKRPYCVFHDAIKQAEAVALIGWLEKIEQAANQGTWQAAAWKAERRHREFRQQSVELTGQDGAPLNLAPQVVIYLPQKQPPPEEIPPTDT